MHVHTNTPADARATVVLGHGAGKGTDTSDLQLLASALPQHGVAVMLVDQPWVLAGRRVAAPARQLDAAWSTVLAALRDEGLVRGPLVTGGRSTGARVACRTALGVAADALLLLAFPLSPPSSRRDPVKSEAATAVRLDELAAAAPLPVVIAQGDKDAFGSGAALAPLVSAEVVAVPGADHSLRVRASGDAVAAALTVAALRAVDLAAGRAGRALTPP